MKKRLKKIKLGQWLGLALNGKKKCWQAYWIVLVAGGFVMKIVAMLLFVFLADLLGMRLFLSALIANTLLAIYCFMVTIIVWRCAYHARHKFWGHLVRAILLLFPISYIGSLVNLSMNAHYQAVAVGVVLPVICIGLLYFLYQAARKRRYVMLSKIKLIPPALFALASFGAFFMLINASYVLSQSQGVVV